MTSLHLLAVPAVLAALILPASTRAAPIEVRDHNGDLVRLTERPRRVATLATVPDTMVIAIDRSADRLVGVPAESKKALNRSVLAEHFPTIRRINDSIAGDNGAPNIEELLKLDPQIVYQWASERKSIETMRRAGLSVAAVAMELRDNATESATERWLGVVGGLMGEDARVAELLALRRAAFDRILAKTRAIAPNRRPRALYLVGEDKAVGRGMFLTDMLAAAGAVNVVEADRPIVSFDTEQLLHWNPDVIILHHLRTRRTPQDFYDNPTYAELKAVKDRRIYKVPMGGTRWDAPSQEQGLALSWFARVIHGPAFMDGSLRKEILAAWPRIYGREISDAQINRILMPDLNGASANYAAATQ